MQTLIAFVTRLFGKKARRPQPEFNRRQRRAIAFARTFTRIYKRKRKKGITRGDHGAKARRAFALGQRVARDVVEARVRDAYLLGLEAGKKQQVPSGRWSILPVRTRKAKAA